MTGTATYDRETIESLRGMDRPKVRCRIEVVYVDQDGNREHGTKDTVGQIEPDGNWPWVISSMGGRQLAFQVSWGLLLEVLNDRHAPPIWMNQDDPVELEV